MKGTGTFRRSLVALAALMGLSGGARPRLQETLPPVPDSSEFAHEPRYRAQRKHRGSFVKRTHNLKRAGWPLITWGLGGKPLSRKALKKICPQHPILSETR